MLEGFPAVSEGQAASQVSFWGARAQPLETGTKPAWCRGRQQYPLD